jgi:hypothetical protein
MTDANFKRSFIYADFYVVPNTLIDLPPTPNTLQSMTVQNMQRHGQQSSDVAAEWLTYLLHMRSVRTTSQLSKPGIINGIYRRFPQSLQAYAGIASSI